MRMGHSPSCRLTRLLPFRQQAVRVDFHASVIADVFKTQTTLQRPVAPCVEQVRASADVLGADENLRDGLLASTGCQDRANLSAEIIFLVLDGVQIDTVVLDADP